MEVVAFEGGVALKGWHDPLLLLMVVVFALFWRDASFGAEIFVIFDLRTRVL